MIRTTNVLLIALACVTCVACATPDGRRPVVRSDSAGVEIVESRVAAWGDASPWRLSAEPVSMIGVAAGDSLLEFNRIRRAVKLSSGHVVVANGGPPVIRVIADDGVVVRSIGRPGDGPGEFRSLDWIETAGDTIIALDSRARRITAFRFDGALAWSIDIREGAGSPRPGSMRLSDGTLVVHRAETDALTKVAQGTESTGQTLRNTSRVLRYGRSGEPLNDVVIADGLESSMLIRNGLPAMAQAPFGRDLVYVVREDRVVVGTQETYEVREYAPDGVLHRIIRWTGPELAITPQDIESLRADYLAQTQDNPNAAQMFEQLLAEIPFPPGKAAYGRLVVDAEGLLWVAAAASPGTWPGNWSVFTDDGELLGTVAMPAGFQLHEAGSDYILGVCRSDDGVEVVCTYGLDRSNTVR